MRVLFLTPLGALLALGLGVPLAALLLVRRRALHVRRALRLPELPRTLVLVTPLAALLGAGTLVALAAAQPVVERTKTRHVRVDAEAFVVVDTTRSMLARKDARSATRLARAKAAAMDVRASLADVPVGIASLTDRVLPHLFPSAAQDVFQATLERSIGIERPPPRSGFSTNATNLGALGSVVSRRFFSASARNRLLVVLTDGETQPVFGPALAVRFREPPGVKAVFVHVWDDDERVFTRGAPEPEYQPDPRARTLLSGVAAAVDGSVYGEEELAPAAAEARRLVGDGPTTSRGERRDRVALAPYLTVAAFLPLTILLRRRDR
jgi:hypothetical protein